MPVDMNLADAGAVPDGTIIRVSAVRTDVRSIVVADFEHWVALWRSP